MVDNAGDEVSLDHFAQLLLCTILRSDRRSDLSHLSGTVKPNRHALIRPHDRRHFLSPAVEHEHLVEPARLILHVVRHVGAILVIQSP